MKKVHLDIDFIVNDLPKNGFELAGLLLKSEIPSSHEALNSMLDSSWPKIIRERSPLAARQFLTSLKACRSPVLASGFLSRFLAGADAKEANCLLMEKQPNDYHDTVIASWALNHDIPSDVFVSLLKMSRDCGADLESTFSYSVYDSNGSRNGQHSLISMLIGCSRNFLAADNYQIGNSFHMARVLDLSKVGKQFDKRADRAMESILKTTHKGFNDERFALVG